MAAVNICSGFGALENNLLTVSIVSPSIYHEVMGPDAKIEYYLAIKKNGILPFVATWINPEIITLSEVNLTEKRQLSCDITYM